MNTIKRWFHPSRRLQLVPAAGPSNGGQDKAEVNLDCGVSPIHVARATDQGQNRDYNEDSLFCWSAVVRKAHDYVPFAVGIVADGMGGHDDGDKASELATQIVSRELLQEIYLPFLDSPEEASPKPVNEVLTSAVEAANRTVCQALPGAGTTCTAALLMGNTAFIVHVGDSRAYLIHQGSIRHLTNDHSLVGRLVEVGAITEEEAKTHPHRNIVYRSVGQGDDLQADWLTADILPESYLLLCSDGLWGNVSDQEILDIVEGASDIQQACDDLVETARRQGSTDDVTVLLLPWSYHGAGA